MSSGATTCGPAAVCKASGAVRSEDPSAIRAWDASSAATCPSAAEPIASMRGATFCFELLPTLLLAALLLLLLLVLLLRVFLFRQTTPPGLLGAAAAPLGGVAASVGAALLVCL